MPKSSFFIRATIEAPKTNTFVQSTIPLGSYVDALGQAVLRVHNVEYEWTELDGTPAFMDGNKASAASFQLTTQSQSSLITLFDKSCLAKCMIWARNPDATVNAPATVYNDSHAPQHFSNGYLVAVETLYLGAMAGADWENNIQCSVVMECTVEKMSRDAAMALSLSQQ